MEWVILVFKNENTTGKHADKNGLWAYHVLISIICITKQTQYTQFTHKYSNMQTRQLQVGVHLNLNGKMESKSCGVSCVYSCIEVLRIFVNRLRWFVYSAYFTFIQVRSHFSQPSAVFYMPNRRIGTLSFVTRALNVVILLSRHFSLFFLIFCSLSKHRPDVYTYFS